MALPYQGTKTLQPFSPRWADPDLLEKTSIGRKALIDKLEQLAIEGAGGPNKYQRLLIGPRGSGKTHVLKVLHTRLWRRPALREKLLIIYLLEDELGVASIVDFLVRLLRAVVAAHPGNKALAADLDALYDLPAQSQQRRAVDLLLQTAGSRDVLILMENLGVTFDSKQGFGRKGQQALRDLVQQNPRFMIFATAQALLDGISEPNAPFFEFFKIEPLKRLSRDESIELLVTMAEAYGMPGVVEYLKTPQGIGRVHAIYDFTGGNHRLLVNFYEVLAADSLSRLSDLFIEALEPLKPYYQEQMRSLSAQQQKIVQFLSVARTPKTVKEIARGCLVTSNTVSSQMQALLDRRLVERIPQGRETYYEVSETPFRICHEADLDEGAPTRLFVDFLGNLYTAKELERRALGFRLLAKGADPDALQEAEFYLLALDRYHGLHAANDDPPNWKDFLSDLMNQKAFQDVISFARRLGDTKDTEIALVEADAHAELGNVEEACALLRREIQAHPDNNIPLIRLGDLLMKSGDNNGAEAHYRDALALSADSVATEKLLVLLLEIGRVDEAEELARKRIAEDPGDPMAISLLAWLTAFDQPEESLSWALLFEEHWGESAFSHILRAAALAVPDPERASDLLRSVPDQKAMTDAWEAIGKLLRLKSKPAEAVRFFETAVSIQPDATRSWSELADTYRSLGKLEEAEGAYRKVLELDPKDANAALRLAQVLIRTDREGEVSYLLERAETATDKAGLHRTHGWLKMGDDWESAVEQFQKSAILAPEHAGTQLGLAICTMALNRMEESSKALCRALEVGTANDPRKIGFFLERLFSAGTQASIADYLSAVLEACVKLDKIPLAKQSLSLATLSLLRHRDSIPSTQLEEVIAVLQNTASQYLDVTMPLKFLRAGIAYFQNKDEKALLELTREERQLFTKELGISPITAAE